MTLCIQIAVRPMRISSMTSGIVISMRHGTVSLELLLWNTAALLAGPAMLGFADPIMEGNCGPLPKFENIKRLVSIGRNGLVLEKALIDPPKMTLLALPRTIELGSVMVPDKLIPLRTETANVGARFGINFATVTAEPDVVSE